MRTIWNKEDECIIEKMYSEGKTNKEILNKIKEINNKVNSIHQVEKKISKMKLKEKYERKSLIIKDIIGKRYGMLEVLEYEGIDKHGRNIFKCRCSCENHTIVRRTATQLNHGSDNCGCLKTARHLETKGIRNKYILDKYEYGVGYTNGGHEFYFDKEDYEKISKYIWCKQSNGYLISYSSGNHQKGILMHRLIMSPDDNQVVDHINRVKTDNRKENLRICSQKENARNRSISNRNKSGIVGVYWYERYNKWRAEIKVDDRTVFLGYFKELKDAANARKQAEAKYFGDFFDHESINHEYYEQK